MLKINHLTGFGGKRGASAVRTITYQSTANSGSVSYPVTFSSQAIGSAASDRFIVVCVSNNTTASLPTSVTVAGQSCTLLARASGSDRGCDIFITDSPVTSGTTANIVLNGSGTVDETIGVFTLTGGNTATAHATATDSTDPLSISINVPANGCVVATGMCGDVTFSMSGITQRYSDGTGNYDAGGGSDNYTVAQTGLTISVSGSLPKGLVAVSFGP